MKDVFASLKKNISLRQIAKQLDTTAANLSMIQKGNRKLSKDLLEKVSIFMKLNKQEFNSSHSKRYTRQLSARHRSAAATSFTSEFGLNDVATPVLWRVSSTFSANVYLIGLTG